MNSYKEYPLVLHNWPIVSEGNTGVWHSTWSFELVSPHESEVDLDGTGKEFSTALTRNVRLVTGSPEESFTVCIRADSNRLNIKTTTPSHLIGSEYMSAIIELFELVEQHFGQIKRIQGQPRNSWPPWSNPVW
jgi:hypothetical protein